MPGGEEHSGRVEVLSPEGRDVQLLAR